jgi:hypothetical protein
MRNSWARAWIAAAGLLAAAAAIARSRTSMLLKVEEPVMDWLLDGTDTSIWDKAGIFSATWLIIIGTFILTVVAFFLEKRVAAAVVITSVFGLVLTNLVSNIVVREAPLEGIEVGTFPSSTIVQTGVFWGLVVLVFWWVGAPKLVWQIILELAIVLTLVSSIRLIVAGEIWPSDAAGSAIAIALTLITAAIVFEANPPKVPAKKPEVVAAA